MDEQALIASARKGDARAFNQLVLLYQTMVYNLAYRILSDPDAVCRVSRRMLQMVKQIEIEEQNTQRNA